MALLEPAGSRKSGAALVIVLSIVALLSVMVIAFLKSSTRQVGMSQSASVSLKGTEVAALASGQVIQDLLQEIKAGSVEVQPKWFDSSPSKQVLVPSSTSVIRYPATPLGAVPDRSAVKSAAFAPPNLVRQSVYAKPAYDAKLKFSDAIVFPQASQYPVTARASTISTDASGAYSVTPLRWNRPLLLPRANPGDPNDLTPATTGKIPSLTNSNLSWQWRAPDWVFLQRDGNNPTAWSASLPANADNPVVARYAYQMYDIGGLLDLNVAGYDPSLVADDLASRRGSTGLADLTQLGFTTEQLKKLFAQRNAATMSEKDALPGELTYGNRYVNYLLKGQYNLGFMRVVGASSANGLTNRSFYSRLGLMGFVQSLTASDKNKALLVDALQSLTHFSRSLDQPSFRPGFYDPTVQGSTPLTPVFTRPSIIPPAGKQDDVLYPISSVPPSVMGAGDIRKSTALGGPLPYEMGLSNNRGGNDAWGSVVDRSPSSKDPRMLQDIINPGLLEVRVVSTFTRRDGSPAVVGEPLVKKRFPLERLAWLTCRGPSAQLASSDPLFNAGGDPVSIYDCFGLTWTQDPSGSWFWAYDHGKKGGVYKLEDLLSTAAAPSNAPKGAKGTPREPDFLELLKATIGVGSLGKSAMASHRVGQPWDASTYYQVRDRNSTFQLVEIFANLIDQYDSDSFPTIIKLPNPDPKMVPAATAYRFDPPLFTARGVEDLPYFYRLLWRGIEDKDDPPMPPPTSKGITEVTGNLSKYSQSAGFRCGTTFVMAFPELWNPHAQGAIKVPDDLKPAQFRVVAASETPGDLLQPALIPSDPTDVGFSKLPKLDPTPGLWANPGKPYLWRSLLNNNNVYDFTINLNGFFAYVDPTNPSNNDLLLWQANTQSSFMSLNGNNWTWTWPVDQQSTTAVGYFPPFYDRRYLGLFWTNASRRDDPDPATFAAMQVGDRITTYFLSFASMWRLPDSATSDDTYLQTCMLPQPITTNGGWPDITPQFNNNVQGSLGTRSNPGWNKIGDVPAPITVPQQLSLVKLTDGSSFTWDPLTNTYVQMPWPLIPDPFKNFMAASYVVGDGVRGPGPLKYSDGTSVQNPVSGTYQPWRRYLRALTDKPGVQRRIVQSSPLSKTRPMGLLADPPLASSGPLMITPYNTAGQLSGGNMGTNRAVDIRGTELRFTLGNDNIFREPTALCMKDFPVGSNLEAGPDNFFSQKPFGGSIKGTDNNDWVGFCLGELPSQFLVACKMFKRDRVVTFDSLRGVKSKGTDGNDVPQDIYQNVTGQEYSVVPPNYFPALPPTYMPGGGSLLQPTVYKLRHFLVPVNATGIWNTRLTVRVQYMDPISKQWLTYDERYMETDDTGPWGGTNGVLAGSSVIGKTEMKEMNHPVPQLNDGTLPWTDNKRTIGWSLPLVTSYDPRTTRFGLPMRRGFNKPFTIHGTVPSKLQMVGPSKNDANDPGFFGRSDPVAGKSDFSDRPGNAVVDQGSGSIAQTMTANWLLPGAWIMGSNLTGNGEDFLKAYQYASNQIPPPPPSSSNGFQFWYNYWWAMAKDPVKKGLILQQPSANAVDFGWHPRSFKNPPSGYTKSAYYSPADPNLPNFFQDILSGNPDVLKVGNLSENIQPGAATSADPMLPYRQAYADPDDVVRRASGALAPLGGYSTVEGLPLGQGTVSKTSNRPIILNRPFRSVAEMGMAFRGAPWKHLDFFLPESADAALLDVFCLSEPPPVSSGSSSMVVSSGSSAVNAAPPLVAGKVNLNTRQVPVIKAMLAGTLKDELTEEKLSAESNNAAVALVDRTTGTKPWQGPLTNVSEVVGKLFAKDLALTTASTDPVYISTSYRTATEPLRNPDMTASRADLNWYYTGYSADLDKVFPVTKDKKTKRLRESVMRALADGGQTRVWNLMLDLVVQTGRFAPSAGKLEDFVREGENRVWVYLAIDRLTGEILDQQLEWVTD